MEIVLLTNILSPYRKVFFDLLHREFEGQGIGFTVLVMADKLYNSTKAVERIVGAMAQYLYVSED